MELLPVRTRVLQPPQDDLYTALDESLTDLSEGDIVLITSKVVAIHQGRCVPVDSVDKQMLVKKEAEHTLPSLNTPSLLAVKYGALFFGAGIDESNGDGHYVLLPNEPFEEAKQLWMYLRNEHRVSDLGVIITDSHSLPFRYGVMSIAISFWGLEPIQKHQGKRDLFGREIKMSSTNMVDALAAASSVVSGESGESTPIVIAHDIDGLRFTEKDVRESFLIPQKEDLYYTLLKEFYE